MIAYLYTCNPWQLTGIIIIEPSQFLRTICLFIPEASIRFLNLKVTHFRQHRQNYIRVTSEDGLDERVLGEFLAHVTDVGVSGQSPTTYHTWAGPSSRPTGSSPPR